MADATAAAERTLPHNLEAEKCVLGAILISNEAFNHAAELIDSGDFFREAHRRIFDKMVSLNERGQVIDLVTLKEELGRSGKLQEVGGPAYIAGLPERRAPLDQYRALRAYHQRKGHSPQPDSVGHSDHHDGLRGRARCRPRARSS